MREHLPDLPAGVKEVVFQALAKDPQQRFARVGDFTSALEAACDVTQFLAVQGLSGNGHLVSLLRENEDMKILPM